MAARLGIEKMEEYFAFMGMPTRLKDFGLDAGCIDRLAQLCTFGKTRTVKSYVDLDYDRIKEIFEISL